MKHSLSIYDILHPNIDFFDMVDTCEDIISKSENYGIIVRPSYVMNIKESSIPADLSVTEEWYSTFGFTIPTIIEIMKVTDAKVYEGVKSFKFNRWLVPDILHRGFLNSTELRLIFKKNDLTKFEYKYIIQSESPHFAIGEELDFILKYKRFFEGHWYFQNDFNEKDIYYCDFNISEIALLGTSAEINDIWKSIEEMNSKGLPKSDPVPKKFRPLNEIAVDIQKDWKDIEPEAKHSLDSLFSLSTIDEMNGNKSGRDIVNTFIWFSDNWIGEIAESIKAELKDIVGYNKVKCYFIKEDETSTAWFVTDKKDFSKISTNVNEAIFFSHEEANIIMKDHDYKEFECCILDPDDDETIKNEIANIIANITIHYDSDVEKIVEYKRDANTINKYVEAYKDVIAYLIDKCDGTYGDFIKKVKIFCDFSEFM